MNETLNTLFRVLIWATFILSIIWVIAYHVTARWWETDFGRSLMIYQVSMSIILGTTGVQTLYQIEHLAFSIFVLAVFAVVPLALAWRLLVLIRVQRRAGHDDD